jgi:hypothetical protein
VDGKYLQQVIPDPFTILGLELRPLSIGRLLLLHRFGLLASGHLKDFPDLVLAVMICSRPVSEVSAFLRSRRLPLAMWLWRKRVGRNPERMATAFGLFQRYAKRPQIGVNTHDNEPEGAPGAPWLQHLRVELLSKCHWTIGDIEERPYGEAVWDYYTYWENLGKLDIDEGERLEELAAVVGEANARHAEIVKAAAQQLGVAHG